MLIPVLSWNGQSILGSLDTLTRGAVGMCSSMYCLGMVRVSWELGIPWERKVVWTVSLIILAPSQDGQSITRSQYTKGDGVGCICAGAGAILEWSEYFGICVLVWYNTYSILRISAIWWHHWTSLTSIQTPYMLQANVHDFGCTTSKHLAVTLKEMKHCMWRECISLSAQSNLSAYSCIWSLCFTLSQPSNLWKR